MVGVGAGLSVIAPQPDRQQLQRLLSTVKLRFSEKSRLKTSIFLKDFSAYQLSSVYFLRPYSKLVNFSMKKLNPSSTVLQHHKLV